MKIAGLILFAAMIGGCQSGTTSHAGGGKMMIRTELIFGAGRTDGANVSDWAWQSFVDHEVSPRFPEGFTVIPADGQWKSKTGPIVHEHSWMLIVIHPAGAESDRKIDELRDVYKKRFAQDSVMREDLAESVSF